MSKITVGGQILKDITDVLELWMSTKYVEIADGLLPLFGTILALYIVFMGYRLMFKGDFGIGTGGQALSLLLAIMFSTQILMDVNLFKDWIFDPLYKTSISLTTYFLSDVGVSSSKIEDIFIPVDRGFSQIYGALETYQSKQGSSWLSVDVGRFIIMFGITLLFSVLYLTFTLLIILPIFSLYILLALAPVMIMFAGFDATRPFFKNWYKAILGYALTPIFTGIIMGITLKFIGRASEEIASLDPTKSLYVPEVAIVFIIGGISLFMHLRATEYASAITGAQIGSLGGFIGATSGAVMMGAGAIGVTNMTRALRDSGIAKAISGTKGTGSFAAKKAAALARGASNASGLSDSALGKGIGAGIEKAGNVLNTIKDYDGSSDSK